MTPSRFIVGVILIWTKVLFTDFYRFPLVTFPAARGPAHSLPLARVGHVPACSSAGRATCRRSRERESESRTSPERASRHSNCNRLASTASAHWPAVLRHDASFPIAPRNREPFVFPGGILCAFLDCGRRPPTGGGSRGSHGFLRHLEAHLLQGERQLLVDVDQPVVSGAAMQVVLVVRLVWHRDDEAFLTAEYLGSACTCARLCVCLSLRTSLSSLLVID